MLRVRAPNKTTGWGFLLDCALTRSDPPRRIGSTSPGGRGYRLPSPTGRGQGEGNTRTTTANAGVTQRLSHPAPFILLEALERKPSPEGAAEDSPRRQPWDTWAPLRHPQVGPSPSYVGIPLRIPESPGFGPCAAPAHRSSLVSASVNGTIGCAINQKIPTVGNDVAEPEGVEKKNQTGYEDE